MSINVGLINDYPIGIGFGGKEIQMFTYNKYVNLMSGNKIKTELINYWDKDILSKFDIFHFFGFSNWFYYLTKLLNKKKKLIISPTIYYSNEKKVWLGSLLGKICPLPNYYYYKNFFLRNVDLIIVNSYSEKTQILKIFDKNLSSKVKIIYNAIENDFNKFKNDVDINVFLKKFNIEPGYLLSVAFLEHRKNTLNLLKAYLKVENIVRKPLVLIGDIRESNSEYKNSILRILEKNKDKIVHIPYIDRKKDETLLKSAYFNCHAHVLPSFIETPGLSNLEAAYFDKPILVGDCEPVREYFKDYAVYCNPNSINDIANKLIEISQIKSSNNISKFIENNYTLNVIIPKLINIYETI